MGHDVLCHRKGEPATVSRKDEIARQDARYVDPNRRHLFVESDAITACHRCEQPRGADIHDGPWLRGDHRWDR